MRVLAAVPGYGSWLRLPVLIDGFSKLQRHAIALVDGTVPGTISLTQSILRRQSPHPFGMPGGVFWIGVYLGSGDKFETCRLCDFLHVGFGHIAGPDHVFHAGCRKCTVFDYA